LFPVATDQYCRMHILNSKELSMLPHVPRFSEAGVDRVRIEAKYMDAAAVAKITGLYRELIDQGNHHQGLVNGQIESLEGTTITRGHYFRGVL
jgi:U32 family peptidase